MNKFIVENKSGNFILYINNGLLTKIDLPFNADSEDLSSLQTSDVRSIDAFKLFSKALEDFLTTEFDEIDFNKLSKFWKTPDSPFYSKVYKVVMSINPGETFSYKEVATKCGNSNAARAVGGAMRNNPYPLLIPCHRVIGSNGTLTGYSGNKGLKYKQNLLNWEKQVNKGQRFVF